jgi:hypothetical protein
VDIATLRELTRALTPTMSLYVGRRSDAADDAAEKLYVRLRTLTQHLVRAETDPPTLRAVREQLAKLAPGEGYVLFARDGAILLGRTVPDPRWSDHALFAAPAAVAPLLEWAVTHPAHVVVVPDRAGGEMISVAAGTTHRYSIDVAGPDDRVEDRVPKGDRQPALQRRAVAARRIGATAVAAIVIREARRIGAHLVFVAGDVHDVRYLREQLATAAGDLVIRSVPGGRAADEPARRDRAVARLVAECVDERMRDDLRTWRDLWGPGGRGIDGLGPTLRALAAGRVQTLLLATRPDDDRTAWFGARTLCAETPTADEPVQIGRLVDVAVRAALLTDAEVRFVTRIQPGGLVDGIGAVCRFADGA